MGQIHKPPAVKLIAGFIFKQEGAYERAKNILQRKFGRIDFESEILAFTYTDYYKDEFGTDLKRRFVSFKKLVFPYSLAQIKIATNKIEQRLAKNSLRVVNIDPGYLTLAKLVLVSTKDYSHRIYLGRGIYAEITLIFKNGTFIPLDWTYLDYKTPEYISIFTQIRKIYSE